MDSAWNDPLGTVPVFIAVTQHCRTGTNVCGTAARVVSWVMGLILASVATANLLEGLVSYFALE